MAFATPLIIHANLGCDPFTAFNQGLGKATGLSFGMATTIFNSVFFLLLLIFDRNKIRFATVAFLFLLGVSADFFLHIFSFMQGESWNTTLQMLSLLLGILAIAFGLGLYQAAGMGANPADSFNQLLADKLKITLRTQQIIYDTILIVSAFFLGGTINIGTVFGILLIGPIMTPVFHRVSRLIYKVEI